MMEHGLIAVRLYDDGREQKAVAAVWEQVFGIKNAVLGGDVFEKDGIKWFTPGNGCDTFTAEVRPKMLAAFKELGVEAEDWTAGEENDDKALADAGITRAGDVVPVKAKDGKLATTVVLAEKPKAP